MNRIFLFLITNIAIMVVLSITLRILGVDSLLAQNGSDLNINALVIFQVFLVLEVPLSLLPFQNGWLNG